MRERLIAFTGLAGSGKSTAAGVLVEEGWRLVPFAEPLKAMLSTFYRFGGLTEPEIAARIAGDLKDKPDAMLNGHSPRWAMQTLGTEWGREIIAEHIWASLWAARVAKLLAEGEAVVCDDLRFPNEREVVEQFGGTVVRLTGRALGIPTTHASETGQIEGGWNIANGGSEEELRVLIRQLFGRERFQRICTACGDAHIVDVLNGDAPLCPVCTPQALAMKETA